jgi:hypothetical protein
VGAGVGFGRARLGGGLGPYGPCVDVPFVFNSCYGYDYY